ncbi:hypothetical protein M9H77_04559 [Catharanthus roseus]|uniref:Uncharacterized protein n=1 Tax=Catharanthus roseus TaxID=4058 RepID=A0ACC0CEF7_CATRO|nr:hypothetical protein M9H77_04559 [Catharanthus roseus]
MSRGLALGVASPSGYFLAGWVRRGPSARVEQGGLVEKSNVRTLYFGVQAGIDYGMPELIPMTPFKVPTLSVEPIMVHAYFLKSSGVVAVPMYLDSLRLSGCARTS